MAVLEQVIEGRVVGYAVREFDSFTRGGEVVPAGTTRSLWVSTDFTDSPAEVSVPAVEAHRCDGLVFGNQVAVKCRVFARGDRISLRLVSVDVVTPVSALPSRGAHAGSSE